MILSTKGRYGLKAMFELARCYGQDTVPMKQIAAAHDISVSYLELLLAELKRAGLVESIRGPSGGYRLPKHPKDIKVGDVIRALEGDMAPTDCVLNDNICSGGNCCPTKPVWQKVYKALNEVLDSMTLQDMVDDYNEKTR